MNPHNPAAPTTPTTVAARRPASQGLAIIPATPVTEATTQTIVSPPATRFQATNGVATGGY